jgi:hypothetical protein
MTIENFTQAEIDRWQCPACQSKCVCASCSRKHDMAVMTSRKMAAAAMHHAAATAAAQAFMNMPNGMAGLMNMPPNMALMRMQLAAAGMVQNLTPEQRSNLLKPTPPMPQPVVAPTAAATVAAVPAIVPSTPTTPTPSFVNAQPTDTKTPLVPIPISLVPAHSQTAVLVPSQSTHRSHHTVTAVAVAAAPAHSGVVMANAVVSGIGMPVRRPRAFSCPTSPVHGSTTAFAYPATMPHPSRQPPHRPHPASVQSSHRQLQLARPNSEATNGMPQRHRRHSLKVTPLPNKKAQYHGTIAYTQMMQQQAQETASSRYTYPSHLDAHSEMMLPASFSQSMSISSQDTTSGSIHESLYLHSAPVSPSRHSQPRHPAAVAHAVQCDGPVLAAIDLSSQPNINPESPQQTNDVPILNGGDSQMMLISPLNAGSPFSQRQQQQQLQQQSHNLSMLHSPPNYMRSMITSPHLQQQQHLTSGFLSPQVHQISPQISPQTLQYQQSFLSSYLQQQQQQPIYSTSPTGGMQVDTEMSQQTNGVLMDSMHHLGPSHSMGLDSSSSVITSDESHRLNLQPVGTNGETLNLHLNLDDPTATLNTINQLQVTLQSVINSKTAQAQVQQNLLQLAHNHHTHQHQQQQQQQQQIQDHQQQQLVGFNTHHDVSLDLVPFSNGLDSHGLPSDPLGLDPFPGGPSGDVFAVGLDSYSHPASHAHGSPTFAFTSSHPLFGSSPGQKHSSHSNSNTPSFLNTSPTTSPRHAFVGSSLVASTPLSASSSNANVSSSYGTPPSTTRTTSSPSSSSTPFQSTNTNTPPSASNQEHMRARMFFREANRAQAVHQMQDEEEARQQELAARGSPASPSDSLVHQQTVSTRHQLQAAQDFASATLS